MKEEILRIRNESTLLPRIMLLRQHVCVNKECERFSHPATIRPLPPPRFQRGKDFLSEKEQARLEQLRKVAMLPGLESTSLKVIDAISTYLAAGHPALMAINQAAASQVVKTYAYNQFVAAESRGEMVITGPEDVVVRDLKTHRIAKKMPKSEWTQEDESKYVRPGYLVQWNRDFTPEWLTERLRGDDLQAELLRLFRDNYRRVSHDYHGVSFLGARSIVDTSEGIAARIGKDHVDVRRELDKLVERGVLIKDGTAQYFDISIGSYVKLDQRRNKPKDKPKTASPIEPALLQQLAPDSQREIELTCLRLLQEVAISSEFEITSVKVIEAIETLEATAIPALIEIENRAANQALRTYAHDTIIRIMESKKEPKQAHPEQDISFNCPNCGGIAPGGTSRCDYCGVELILGERGFLPRSIMSCPKCGNSMAGNAWFCVNCLQILASDVTRLKELQKKLLLEQENYMQLIRRKMPEIHSIEPEEFIYSLHYQKVGRLRSYEVITDRKLILYTFRGRRLREIPWNEFVRLAIPWAKKVPYDILHRLYLYILPVQTLKEDFGIRFQHMKHGIFVRGDWEGCLSIYRTIKAAQNDYNTQRRNIKAIICGLAG